MSLKQHRYYIYYDENNVFARMEDKQPIKLKTFKTSQEAHDYVQKIINPEGIYPSMIGPKGFLEDSFQDQISIRCENVVKSAYGVS